MTDLWILDALIKIMMTETTNSLRKKGHLKQVLRNSLKENVMYAARLVTKAQIVGHWKVIKTNDLPDTTTKMMVTEIIRSTVTATIATKKPIKKLTAGPNSRITQTMQKKNSHL